MKIKPASGLSLWFLETYGYGAITMPWKTIYVRPSRLNDTGLLEHEKVHISQIEKLGAIKFTLMYLWYNIRYGYWNNPFEIEARYISGHN